MSAICRFLLSSSRGQCDPLFSILFIHGQIGRCLKMTLMEGIFLNSDPIPRGELLLASSARCRLPQCFFIRLMQFFLVLSRSKENENSGGDGQLHGVDVVALMILMRFGGQVG
jgi:hypothetical protein